MMKYIAVVFGFVMLFGGVAKAQEGCDGPWPKAGDPKMGQYEQLLDCIKQSVLDAHKRLEDLSNLQVADFANGLEQNRDRLSGLLESSNQELAQAKAEVEALVKERDQLQNELAKANTKNDEAAAEIKALVAAAEKAAARIAELKKERDDLKATLAAAQGKNAEYIIIVAGLEREKADLEARLKQCEDELNAAKAELEDLRKQLAAKDAEIAKRDAEIIRLNGELTVARDTIKRLETQVADLNEQLKKANETIAALGVKIKELEDKIAALACNVDRLAAQRSAFFASLSTALGKGSGVTIVGDRFVIPSGVLFPVGSAAFNPGGRDQIVKAAGVVRDLEQRIPAGISWLLQVDGHTDIQKILPGSKFKDNWELSTARALTVIELLRKNEIYNVPGEHLAAAGFGEFHPARPEHTQEAFEKNRRIEFKLTDDGPGNQNSSADGKECPQVVSMN